MTDHIEDNHFKSYSELVAILQTRGMAVDDSPKAERKISQVGYYRLSGYWYPCRLFDLDPEGNQKICGKTKQPQRLKDFLPETSFQAAFDLYLFDKKLRLALMDAIERVEIHFRSIIAHELGQIDPFAYQNSDFINPKKAESYYDKHKIYRNAWTDWAARHQDRLNASQEECIVWHRKKGKTIPFWVAIEAWDFGTMSKYFEMLKGEHQRRIAKRLECDNIKHLRGWLKEINTVRNRCAHHSRIWNKKSSNPIDVSSISRLAELKLDISALERIYGIICVLWYLVSTLGPNSTWIRTIADIIDQKPPLPGCGFHAMGFPDDKGFPRHLFPAHFL